MYLSNIVTKIYIKYESICTCTNLFAPATAFATLINAKETAALTVVRPTGVYLLDFFCSLIQFYLLLSPYLCFISFLYLDLFVLGDDEMIS